MTKQWEKERSPACLGQHREEKCPSVRAYETKQSSGAYGGGKGKVARGERVRKRRVATRAGEKKEPHSKGGKRKVSRLEGWP